jgi:hypothetical protein
LNRRTIFGNKFSASIGNISYVHAGTEENHEKLQLGNPNSELKFESQTCQIKNGIGEHDTAMFRTKFVIWNVATVSGKELQNLYKQQYRSSYILQDLSLRGTSNRIGSERVESVLSGAAP